MNKLSKKLMALMLTSAMAMAVTACGSKPEETPVEPVAQEEKKEEVPVQETNEEPSEETSAEPEAAAKPANASHDEYEAVDLGGRTIKIGIWWDNFIQSGYETLDDITAAGGSYDNAETTQMQLDNVKKVEEKWNCKIEFVNLGWDGIIESINTSVTAGTPECDIYLTDMQFGLAPALNGYVQKISSYAPADADVLKKQTVLSRIDVLGDDDMFFAESSEIPSGAMYMAYNASMIEALGLESPEALAAKGEWTWDKFAEYAKACTQDTDGDGNADVYGYGTAWTLSVQGFGASNNAGIATSMTEGLSSPETTEVFEFINKLYNEDKSARPYTDDWNDDLLAWSSGKVAFTFTQPWILIQELPNHDFDMRVAPAPVGPHGDGSMTPPAIKNSYMIPVGVKDPENVYKVFEEYSNWYNYDTSLRDVWDWFESGFVDEEQVELATELGNKAKADYWNVIDTEGAVGNVFFGVAVDKDSTVAQAIESNKQILQGELDKIASK